MQRPSKIILFELNEVPDRVFDDFIRDHPSSFLAQNLPKMRRYQTVAADEGHLSPWKTWPTLHRGVNDTLHGIHDFGQDLEAVDKNYPPIWQQLVNRGIKVGVCGSLHSYPPPREPVITQYQFYLPDPFASGPETHPAVYRPFQAFNLAMTKLSARNVSRKLPLCELFDFILNFFKFGIQIRTCRDVLVHLFKEVLKSERKVRRRTIQSRLLFDVFLKQLKKTKPEFCTFFTNHVASSMHRYWAAQYPEQYGSNQFSREWIETYKNEIPFSMQEADWMLGELFKFVESNPEYQIWICSSMGQAATTADVIKTQVNLSNVEKFMKRLGVNLGAYEKTPSMFPQFNFSIAPHLSSEFDLKLRDMKICGHPLSYRRLSSEFFSLDFGHPNVPQSKLEIEFEGKIFGFEEFGIENLIIEDEVGSCAYHIPKGILLIYSKQNAPSQMNQEIKTISTLDFCPSILKNFGFDPPSYMNGAAF